ncbi:hypothetical protein GCM10009823_20360 [Brevibacterium salitolerans]|uniref:DNA-directed DNA polymerase n=1 Tax=Brevibacterium salitolerans TaxID=1403566 RepID=A0ABP5IEQ5_9MICO
MSVPDYRLGDVSTALYRRYRPETFAEVIGQEHVTRPLSAAIDSGRINHAYLFSGPRGCGKTTSARILARCLNCAEGPTSTPCGQCPSCRDLANGGPGSLDVVEIDAASHNGVDDARDLRERAVYAPARDRYKVFILDEAHMVTAQGFNALLKLVEEPPPHVKFVFATTEPEKVIGTIRSRTHHYPFRLVPPEVLTHHLEDLCERESVPVGRGVLPLVVRAGGGSVRDTLSVLDQLMAGSDAGGIDYATAVALLGYTDDSLLGDIVDAFSAGDGGGVFRVVERVVESGHDPRRFVEDLLERFRDLFVIAAAPDSAQAFLPEVPADRLERLMVQARAYGPAELSRAADLLNVGLSEMSGATSPRLQLELICARILLPAAEDSRRSVLSRVERLERRVGMSQSGRVPEGAAPLPAQAAAPEAPGVTAGTRPGAGDAGVSAPGAGVPGADPQVSGGAGADGPGAGAAAGTPQGSAPQGGASQGTGAGAAALSGRPSGAGSAGGAGMGGDRGTGAEDPFAGMADAVASARSVLGDEPGRAPSAQRPGAPVPSQEPAQADERPEQASAQQTAGAEMQSSAEARNAGPQQMPVRPGGSAGQGEAVRLDGPTGQDGSVRQDGPVRQDAPAPEGGAVRGNPPEQARRGQHPGQISQPGQPQTSVTAQTHEGAPADGGAPTPAQSPAAQAQAPEAQAPAAQTSPTGSAPVHSSAPAEPAGVQSAGAPATDGPATGVGAEIDAIRRGWPDVLSRLQQLRRLSHAIVSANAFPQRFADGVLYLAFNNPGSVQGFQRGPHAQFVSSALEDSLGIRAQVQVGDDNAGPIPPVGGTSGPGAPSGPGGPGAPSGPGGAGSSGAPGNAGGPGSSSGPGAYGAPDLSAPADGSAGFDGPAAGGRPGGAASGSAAQRTSPRQPTQEEMDRVVGPREADRAPVDHERFWQTDDASQAHHGGREAAGDQEADSPAPLSGGAGESTVPAVASAPAAAFAPASGYAAASEPLVTSAETAEPDPWAPAPGIESWQPDPSVSGENGEKHPDGSGPLADAPERPPADAGASDREPERGSSHAPTPRSAVAEDEVRQPSPEAAPAVREPVGPAAGEAESDPLQETAAGDGAVDLGAVVVPPPVDLEPGGHAEEAAQPRSAVEDFAPGEPPYDPEYDGYRPYEDVQSFADYPTPTGERDRGDRAAAPHPSDQEEPGPQQNSGGTGPAAASGGGNSGGSLDFLGAYADVSIAFTDNPGLSGASEQSASGQSEADGGLGKYAHLAQRHSSDASGSGPSFAPEPVVEEHVPDPVENYADYDTAGDADLDTAVEVGPAVVERLLDAKIIEEIHE